MAVWRSVDPGWGVTIDEVWLEPRRA